MNVCIIFLFYIIAAFNLSHKIDHLSFGDVFPGIVNPLDNTRVHFFQIAILYNFFDLKNCASLSKEQSA